MNLPESLREYTVVRAAATVVDISWPLAEKVGVWLLTKVVEGVARFVDDDDYEIARAPLALELGSVQSPTTSDETAISLGGNDAMKEHHYTEASQALLRLETALRSHEPLPVIESIVSEHIQLLERLDSDGLTPLHRACLSGAPIPVVLYLIAAHPAALHHWTHFQGNWPDFLPIHLFCLLSNHFAEHFDNDTGKRYTVCDVIQSMMQYGGGSTMIQKVNRSNSTPLHFATKVGNNSQGVLDAPVTLVAPLIELLVKEYPQAVNVSDQNGKTPLDYACERQVSQPILDLLLLHATDAHRARAMAILETYKTKRPDIAQNALSNNDLLVSELDASGGTEDWVLVDVSSALPSPPLASFTSSSQRQNPPLLFPAIVE